MAMVLGAIFAPMSETYTAIPPDSPEADASPIDSLTLQPDGKLSITKSADIPNRKSFSNADFDPVFARSKPQNASWQDSATAIGQWTTSAAFVMAETIANSARYVHSISASGLGGVNRSQGQIRLSPSSSRNACQTPSEYSRDLAVHSQRYCREGAERYHYDPQDEESRDLRRASSTSEDLQSVHDRKIRDDCRRRQTLSISQSRTSMEQPFVARGIDRSYLRHRTLPSEKGVAAYFEDFVERFTTPKPASSKQK